MSKPEPKLKLRAPRKSYTVGGKRYVANTLYDDAELNSETMLSDLKVGEITVFETVMPKKRKAGKKVPAPDETTVAGGEGDAGQSDPTPVVPNDATPAAEQNDETETPPPKPKPKAKKKAAAKKKAVAKKKTAKGRRVI